MPTRRPGTPKYRHYKPKDLAVVRLSGQDFYLGKFGSAESEVRYDRLVAEWLANGRTIPKSTGHQEGSQDSGGILVCELILAYWNFAKSYYVKEGKPTDEQAGIRCALRFLGRLYGELPAARFGPLKLKAVRETMIDAGLSRGVINQYVNRLRRVFRWGVENECVEPKVYEALAQVAGLAKGRSRARETKRVTAVPDERVTKTLPHLPSTVQAMVQFQRFTGCRPQEVCLIRPSAVDTTGSVWIYWPYRHKMDHTDRERRIFIGPRAQHVLHPWLNRPADAHCFSPQQATEDACAKRRRQKSTPTSPTRLKRSVRSKANRAPGDHYTRHSYRRAISRACERAGVPLWRPNQLRHRRGTEVRKQYGLEASQTLLGHTHADVTEIYAERDFDLAERIARESG